MKRPGARWVVAAGPFRVLVTGTRFAATWDPQSEVLTVSMEEGSVVVSGRCVESRALSAGESASFGCRDAVTQADPPRMEFPRSPVVETTTPPKQPPPRPQPERQVGTSTQSAPPPVAEWNALSREGRFREALAAAETEGFSSLCASMSAEQILQLGNSARLAGSTARVHEAFLSLRRRFPGSGPAATAAFHLGRIAFDGSGDYATAQRWFAAYLAEQPGGGFAEESLGRLMESEHRAGARAAAEASATRYLVRFPNGAHAAFAESLIRK
ncbi:MAG: hypothetical protein IPI67_24390 [Myxococcales bacterium]|nr:hypothetical protein [Myxococcales bacterium]